MKIKITKHSAYPPPVGTVLPEDKNHWHSEHGSLASAAVMLAVEAGYAEYE